MKMRQDKIYIIILSKCDYNSFNWKLSTSFSRIQFAILLKLLVSNTSNIIYIIL